MRNMDRRIRLTEEDLHFVVENAVRQIISENMEDEGARDVWNGFKGVGKRFYSQGQDRVQNMAQNINQRVGKAKKYVQDKWDQGVEAAKQFGDNINATYQTNKLNSQIQTAIQTASDALDNLIKLDADYAKYRNGSTLGNKRQRGTILNAQKVLTNIKSRYNQTADSYASGDANYQRA